jgi:hypothetical protein
LLCAFPSTEDRRQNTSSRQLTKKEIDLNVAPCDQKESNESLPCRAPEVLKRIGILPEVASQFGDNHVISDKKEKIDLAYVLYENQNGILLKR